MKSTPKNLGIGNQITSIALPWRKQCLSLAVALCCASASASINGPYSVDANTLHLWHLDGTGADAVGGVDLNTLGGGATLSSGSFSGFGSALNTSSSFGDYLSVLPLAASAADDVHMTYANATTGAFTYEAIIRIDFDPATFTYTQPLYILAAENETAVGSDRPWQFSILPNGSAGTTFRLRLFNSNGNQSFTTALPTTGPDALAQNNWYHVAVSYDGNGDAREYWTLLDPGNTSAHEIGSFALNDFNPLSEGNVDFTIGNVGRGAIVGGFPGLIDEVRLSDIARSPTDMMFVPVPEPTVLSLFGLGVLGFLRQSRRKKQV